MKRRLFSPSGSCSQAQPKRSCLTQSGGRGDGVRLTKGQSVYVYSQDEAWKEGVVVEVDPSHNVVSIMLEDTGQVSSYSMDEVLLCWEKQAEDLSNLTHVNPVHEATVLSCLQRRFEAGLYYTNAGNTVVAVNPCTDVSHLYTLPVIRAYHQRQQGLPPHIYTVGENAHMNMVRELGQVNQSIVISGESGAGKTVSAKHLLRYLTIVANPAAEKLKVDDKGFQIEQRVVDSNPILEAFGNAATTRNDNSSRFGKFIQLQFLRNGQIQGGAIHTYLLEKTRVMHQSHGDNNFHVFYQMTKRKEEEEEEEDYSDWVQELRNEVADTSFLCVPHHQECRENRELRDTLQAMTRVGLPQHSQRDVFQVLLAILYLGNLSFVQISDDSSDLDGSLGSSSQSDCQDSDDSFFEVSVCGQALERSSQLLGLTPDLLRQTLLHRSLQAGGRQRQSFCIKPLTLSQAGSRRDVLAMLLYCRLFEWLVDFINSRIKAEVSDYVIGLLDIYGFEIFPFNSLEQLCINYANERLQQHYVAHFLKNLQEEYAEECIPWEPMDYNDNRPCLNLLDGRLSVFSLLNEEVYLNRKSDVEGLRDRLLKLGTPSDHCLRSPPLSSSFRHPSFVVQHYAGDVHYTVADLVPKNKDDIPADLISLLTSSHNAFIHQLFASYSQPESPLGRKKKTVLTKFKSSLDELLSSLEESEVHYIRCLRPNVSNTAEVCQPPYLLQQLRACGTIESINIYRQGFPARTAYKEFLERYSLILRSEYRVLADSGDGVDSEDDDSSSSSREGEEEEDGEGEEAEKEEEDVCDPGAMLPHPEMDLALPSCTSARKTVSTRSGMQAAPHHQARKVCALILQHAVTGLDLQQLQQRQFGRSKIFLTEQQLEQLECARLAVLHHSATVLQSCWRGQRCRRRYRHLLAAAAIHRAWLTFRLRRHFLAVKQATLVLQKAWRGLQSRRELATMKRATVVLQRAWSSVLVRRHFLDLRWSVGVVQTAWRGYRARRDFVRVKRAAVIVQQNWRALRARREFVGLKRSARVIQKAWRARRQRLQGEKAARAVKKDTQPQLNNTDTPHHQQRPPAEEPQEVTVTPRQPLTPAKESSVSVATQSSDGSQQSQCPTSQTVPGLLLDLFPAVDGNWSDDSGVMVHEPHQPPSCQEKGGGEGKERGGGEGGGGGVGKKRGGAVRCEVVMSVAAKLPPRLKGVHVGDGVVSWHRIPKSRVRFHTRASVLRYGHVINRWELPLGLPDVLTDVPYGGRQLGSAVD